MAKQKGILPLEGTLGGINFYYRKGVPTARSAGGGFNKKAIKTSPNMARVRQQNSEFAICSRTNKIFKQAIASLLAGYVDGALHSRLMQLFLSIRDCDPDSEHGKRQVWKGMETEAGKSLLQDFRFNPKRPNLLPCAYVFNWDALELRVRGFDVRQVAFPKEADYLELSICLLWFDFEKLNYSDLSIARMTIDRDFNQDTFSLACAALPKGSGMLLGLARVAFYHELHGKAYALSGGSGFGMVVFCKVQ